MSKENCFPLDLHQTEVNAGKITKTMEDENWCRSRLKTIYTDKKSRTWWSICRTGWLSVIISKLKGFHFLWDRISSQSVDRLPSLRHPGTDNHLAGFFDYIVNWSFTKYFNPFQDQKLHLQKELGWKVSQFLMCCHAEK